MENTASAGTGVPAAIYDDDIVKKFAIATLIWGAVGMLVGVIIALQLAWWPANLGLPWTTFGRLRPLHTNAVIFAFGHHPFNMQLAVAETLPGKDAFFSGNHTKFLIEQHDCIRRRAIFIIKWEKTVFLFQKS